ncbi:MAG: DNA cytosine methyltransferase [Ruminococcus sp.]|nr:DNA cytosine methyltransferase [Ruminococcus sp.]
MSKRQRKYRVLDTFAGAGGFSLGFHLTGFFEIVGAIEVDEWAAATFKYNHPNANVIVKSISEVTDKELKEQFSNIDFLLGGPPCQGFSICRKNAGDPKDPRNSLFKEFIRVAKVLSPQIVVMENVPNLIKAKTESRELVINIIKQELEVLGYNVEYRIMEATSFGVPQIRKRLVIIGSKQKLREYFPYPTHTVKLNNEQTLFEEKLKKCPTLWEAISDLPQIEACDGAEELRYTNPPQTELQTELREESTILFNHIAMRHSNRMVQRFAAMKWGESTSDVPDEFKPLKRNGNGEKSEKVYDQNNRRMFPDKPCHTIAASFYANFVHPYLNRNFTPREGARIQTFPDWYRFFGKPTTPSKSLLKKEGRNEDIHLCQYNQIGNAVPPFLSRAIANHLYKQLEID